MRKQSLTLIMSLVLVTTTVSLFSCGPRKIPQGYPGPARPLEEVAIVSKDAERLISFEKVNEMPFNQGAISLLPGLHTFQLIASSDYVKESVSGLECRYLQRLRFSLNLDAGRKYSIKMKTENFGRAQNAEISVNEKGSTSSLTRTIESTSEQLAASGDCRFRS